MKHFCCVALLLLSVVGLSAQIAPAPAPAPAPASVSAPDSKEVAELKAQVQRQAAQLAELQKKPALSPEAEMKQRQDAYARAFAGTATAARPGCKAVGGKLRVLIDSTGKISVDCELR